MYASKYAVQAASGGTTPNTSPKQEPDAPNMSQACQGNYQDGLL